MESRKYWAFISYSHKDNQGPRRWADWLHESIEDFQVPPELVGRPGRGGDLVPARLFPVFQDQKELASSADLGESIRSALAESRYLVVICSPSAAASKYVNEEVIEFKRLGRGSRILALIVEGEPPECFPQALRHPEPIAADARGAGENPRQLDDARLRVVAGLLGVGFDDLAQRDRERQLREERARTRRLRKLVAGFAALAAIAAVAGIVALFARAQSQRNLLEARRRLAQIYVERADVAYGDRDISQQALFLAEARVLAPETVSASVVADLADRTAAVNWAIDAGRDRGEIQAAALAPDEGLYFLGTNTGRVIEIDTASGRIRRERDAGLGRVTCLAASPDGRLLAVGHLGSNGEDQSAGLVSIVERESLRRVRTLTRHRRRVVSLRFDGNDTLLSASDDFTAIVWDLRNGAVAHELAGHTGDVNGITISADRSLLATASSDSTVGFWDPRTGALVRRFDAHDGDVANVVFSPDAQKLMTSGGDATIRVWDMRDGRSVRVLRGHAGSVSALRLSEDGRTVLSAGADQTVRIWDVQSGQLRHRLTGHTGWVVDAQLLRGRSAISVERYGRVIRWTLPEDPDAKDLISGGLTVRRGAFSHDGSLAATGTDDGVIRIWTVADASRKDVWLAHRTSITGLAFLGDGRRMLSASHDETLRLWNVATKVEQARFAGHRSLIWAMAVDRAGLRALSGGADTGLRLWDLRSSSTVSIGSLHTDTINAVAFNADGTLAASGANDRCAIVWDIASNEPRKVLRHEGQVSSIAFGHTGMLATAAWADAVRLWDGRTFQPVRQMSCGAAGCDALAFSPDGHLLIGGGMDGALRVWDVSTGEELRRIPAHLGRIYSVSVSPDGRHVLTTGLNGVARLWDLKLPQLGRVRLPGPDDVARLERIRARTGLQLRDGRVVLPASAARETP